MLDWFYIFLECSFHIQALRKLLLLLQLTISARIRSFSDWNEWLAYFLVEWIFRFIFKLEIIFFDKLFRIQEDCKFTIRVHSFFVFWEILISEFSVFDVFELDKHAGSLLYIFASLDSHIEHSSVFICNSDDDLLADLESKWEADVEHRRETFILHVILVITDNAFSS